MPRLTKRNVASASCPAGQAEAVLWDDLVVGFGLRLRASGARSYIVQYSVARGRKRKYTIGPAGVLGVDDARERARLALLAVLDGKDPAEERSERRASITVAELGRLFLEDRADTKGHATYKSVIENHVEPLLGRRTVAELNEAHCAEAIARVRGGHRLGRDGKPAPDKRRIAKGASIAKLFYSVLGAMMSFAEARRLRRKNSNPLDEIERPRTTPRRIALKAAQYAELGAALRSMAWARTAPAGALQGIWYLALTGCRHNEIAQRRVVDCDADRQTIHLEDSKTGQRLIVVGAAVARLIRLRVGELLEAMDPAEASAQWLLAPVRRGAGPPEIDHIWRRVRDRAGLPGVRLHDLRHSFATLAIEIGVPYPIVQALLGHSTGRSDRAHGMKGTTAEYLHLGFDTVRAGADRIAEAIWAAMNKPTQADLPLIEHRPAAERP